MHIPQTNPLQGVAPISGVDIVLHKFAGVSWHVLVPYTLFGAGLMAYSQVRLVHGQRALKQQAAQSTLKKSPSKKRSRK